MMAQKKRRNQTKVKKTRKSRDARPEIAAAAMRLAAVHGWHRVTPAMIAGDTGLPPSEVRGLFQDTWDVLVYILTDLSTRTRQEVEGYLGDGWRENLMEILMTRFDQVQDRREAFRRLLPDMARSPRGKRRLARQFYHDMKEMLLLAGLPRRDCHPLAVGGFCASYLSLVDAWAKDDTPDLSRTMAAIDKRLGFYETGLDCLARCKPGRRKENVRRAAG